MMVPVNQNIDSYKDDFFKGLTMRQTLFAVAAVVVSGGLLTFFLVYLKINASLAMYLTLPFAFPIIAAGFVRIHGIGLSDYLKRKKKVETQPSFFFQPEMIFWSNQGLLSSEEEALAPAKEKEGKEKGVKDKTLKKFYLETEETVSKDMRRMIKKEACEVNDVESNEGIQGADSAALSASQDGPAADSG